MEDKDKIAAIGIALTFIVGGAGLFITFGVGVWNLVLSYRVSRNTRYGNLVTAERLKWSNELRSTMSQFCGLVQTWMFYAANATSDPAEAGLRKEIDRLGYHINLMLDPQYAPDQKIIALAAQIARCVNSRSLNGVPTSLQQITDETRDHLNREWWKAKTEADKGKIVE